jgi:membrane protease YdiL (CAAX protease family)
MQDLVGRGLGPAGIALLIFAAVILAPIGEETLFRGVLLPWLRRFFSPDVAVWVSAVLFGIGHLRYGFSLATIVVYGLVLGWARLHTGNLRASIVLHMIINAVATGVVLSRF